MKLMRNKKQGNLHSYFIVQTNICSRLEEWINNTVANGKKVVVLEIGAGFNTPTVIRHRLECIYDHLSAYVFSCSWCVLFVVVVVYFIFLRSFFFLWGDTCCGITILLTIITIPVQRRIFVPKVRCFLFLLVLSIVSFIIFRYYPQSYFCKDDTSEYAIRAASSSFN